MSAHAHATTATGQHFTRLVWALLLTSAFLVVEVIGGLWTGSLALLADAGHMLADVGGLVLSLLAAWFARRPPTAANTYGYYRMEILAALANGVVLFGVAAVVLYEAYRRIWAPPEVLAGPMLLIAVVGLCVNLAGMWLLHGGAGRASMSGAPIWRSRATRSPPSVSSWPPSSSGPRGLVLVDPLVSAGIGLFILPRTWGLLRQAIHILMEGVPPHLDPREIEAAMRTAHGVRAVHDLHIWTLTSGREALSAHVLVEDLSDGQHVLGDLQTLLRQRFGIEHVTIQLESDRSPLIQVARQMDPNPGGVQKPGQGTGGQGSPGS